MLSVWLFGCQVTEQRHMVTYNRRAKPGGREQDREANRTRKELDFQVSKRI